MKDVEAEATIRLEKAFGKLKLRPGLRRRVNRLTKAKQQPGLFE